MIAFRKEKLMEMIIYIAQRVSDPTVLRISKLAYMADRRHLQTYGRYISGDFYVGMKNGPVPSRIYNIMTAARDREEYAQDIKVQTRFVTPLRDPDLDEFSRKDLQHLDQVIYEVGEEPIYVLYDLSHDSAWNEATDGGKIFIEGNRQMVHIPFGSIIDTLPDADRVRNYIQDQHLVCKLS